MGGAALAAPLHAAMVAFKALLMAGFLAILFDPLKDEDALLMREARWLRPPLILAIVAALTTPITVAVPSLKKPCWPPGRHP